MPIDRTGEPRSVGQSASSRNPARAASAARRWPDRHQAPHVEAESPSASTSVRRVRRAGSHPSGLARHVHLDEHGRARRAASDLSAELATDRRDCHRWTTGASLRTLLRWSRPMKCHRAGRSPGRAPSALATSSWA